MTKHNHEIDSKNHYDKVASHFNRTWDGFLSGFFKHYIKKTVHIDENDRVLDIGCADGQLLGMLSENQSFEAYGLDISPEMVKVASQKYPKFNFVNGSAQNLPFEDDFFDVLICSASFHHFPDPEGFLKEAKRVLRPNGKLVLAEIRIPIYDVRKIYNAYVEKTSTEGDVKVYGQQELMDLFQQGNFELVKHHNALQIQYYELKKLR